METLQLLETFRLLCRDQEWNEEAIAVQSIVMLLQSVNVKVCLTREVKYGLVRQGSPYNLYRLK